MRREMGKIKVVIVTLLLVGLAAGGVSCRGLGPEPSRERLEARVRGFIKARNERDLEALRGCYEKPADARLGNIHYLASRVEAIELDPAGKKAEVRLLNSFKVMGFTFNNVRQKTDWSWNGRDWYLVVPAQSTPFGPRQGKRAAGHDAPKKP